MDEPYTGGCACGAIRYSIAGQPLFANHCQCRDCQRESGTGHVKTRAFCPTCGLAVYMTFAAMPDIFTIRAASLDEPARYKPQVVTYAARGYDWDRLDPDLPKFAGMPPG